MAKEKGSRYFPGRRSSSWVKVNRMRDADFVIGGYSFGGKREELFSSLLQPLHTAHCLFDNPPVIQKFIYWCRPELVCQVRYGEFNPDRKLRYPVFVSLWEDKAPTDCVVSDAAGWPRVRE